MAKYSAYGTAFKRGAVTVVQVSNIDGPEISLDTEDVTTHDSTDAYEEFVATIIRTGNVSLDLVWDPNAATHAAAAGGLLNDLTARTLVEYSVVFPTTPAATATFDALVTQFKPGANTTGALVASVTLKVSGAIAWT